MKKFVFTLETVLHYKETLEKKQKIELAQAMALLKALHEEKAALQGAVEKTAASLMRALRESHDIPAEMERHDLYQAYLRDELLQNQQKILRAEAEKKRIQTLLIITMKEIKALNRLREEEYAAYLEEVRQEEEKLINDLISFQSAVHGPEQEIQ